MPPAIAFGIHHDYLAGYDAAEHVIGLTGTYIPYYNGSALADSPLTTDGTHLYLTDNAKISFGTDQDAYMQWDTAANIFRIVNADVYYSYTSNQLVTSNLNTGNLKVIGTLTFNDASVYLDNFNPGELGIYAPTSITIGDNLIASTVSMQAATTALLGNMTLLDGKHIAFGNSGFGTDASIAWDASGYLDIQSADTRFSGNITLSSTTNKITRTGRSTQDYIIFPFNGGIELYGGGTLVMGTGATTVQFGRKFVVTTTAVGWGNVMVSTNDDTDTGFAHGGSANSFGIMTGNKFALRCESDQSLSMPNDNAHLYIGASSDIDIYHDGSNSFIDNKTGIGALSIRHVTTTGLSIDTNGIGFYTATPVARATTGGAASTFTANTSGIADDTATWDGYTIGQVVKALRNVGILT